MDIKIIASGSKGNCYFVSDGKTKILLDAGIKFKQIQRRLNFCTGDISACFITHEHSDHSLGTSELTKRGIKTLSTYLSTYTQRTIIGSLLVENFPAVHDVPCVGYKVYSMRTEDELLYATDTAELPLFYNQFTHLLVEANYSEDILAANVWAGKINYTLAERIRATHLSIETLIKWLKKIDTSKLKQTYLLHLSDQNSDAVRFKRQVQEITGSEVYSCC